MMCSKKVIIKSHHLFLLVVSKALDKAAVVYANENLTISRNITNIYKDPKCSAFIIEVDISNGEGC